MTTRFGMAALLILTLPGVAEARGVTVATGNAGSYVRTGSCTQVGGQITCQAHATLTGAQGRTATRDRSTTASAGQFVSTVTGRRANGAGISRSVWVKH